MARRTALAGWMFIAIAWLSACSPEQVALFQTLTPDQQSSVIAALQEKPAGGDCISAMKRTWPASAHAWATGVIRRESGNDPRAQNRSSSAAGCLQLMAVHAPRFNKLGYSWERDRYDATANVRVGLDLYLEAGTSPWRM